MRKNKVGFQLYINSSIKEEMQYIKESTGVDFSVITVNGIKKEIDFLKKLYGLKKD